MTLTIPTDSYVSLEDADNYHRLRTSFSTWNELDNETKLRRLVSASDFLDVNYHFKGEKADVTQAREFPRKGTDGQAQSIPNAVLFAVCELALQAELNQNAEQKMSSVKVGPLSVNYAEQTAVSATINRFEYVRALLSQYLALNQGIGYAKMLRG